MPIRSEAQRRAMQAAAHGHSTLGIPASVGKEFVAAGPSSGHLPKRVGNPARPEHNPHPMEHEMQAHAKATGRKGHHSTFRSGSGAEMGKRTPKHEGNVMDGHRAPTGERDDFRKMGTGASNDRSGTAYLHGGDSFESHSANPPTTKSSGGFTAKHETVQAAVGGDRHAMIRKEEHAGNRHDSEVMGTHHDGARGGPVVWEPMAYAGQTTLEGHGKMPTGHLADDTRGTAEFPPAQYSGKSHAADEVHKGLAMALIKHRR